MVENKCFLMVGQLDEIDSSLSQTFDSHVNNLNYYKFFV